MEIQIFVKGLENKQSLRDYAQERVESVLQRFEERILKVNVRLEDVTGPEKHGVDKKCVVDLKLRKPSGQILIDEIGDDIHATVSLALDRLKAALSREAGKAKRGVGAG